MMQKSTFLNKLKGGLLLTVFLSSLCLGHLESLVLNRVIISTNNNPNYIEFWPVVAPLWEQMGFRPTLALIADENCPIDTSIGDVVRFQPIPGVSEALYAQAVRLLLPILYPDDVCLISDMDMLPVSRDYFVDGALNCPEDAFLVYRDKAYSSLRYPMCYFAAKGSVFNQVFEISSFEEIPERIKQWANYGFGWDTDELVLTSSVLNWEKNGGNVFRLGHGVGPRVDRIFWDTYTDLSDLSNYIDCHCPRPYSSNREMIDKIVAGIMLLNQKGNQAVDHPFLKRKFGRSNGRFGRSNGKFGGAFNLIQRTTLKGIN